MLGIYEWIMARALHKYIPLASHWESFQAGKSRTIRFNIWGGTPIAGCFIYLISWKIRYTKGWLMMTPGGLPILGNLQYIQTTNQQRKMLEIHLLLVERPSVKTAHEPPYSFAPQIRCLFLLGKSFHLEGTSTEKSRQYTDSIPSRSCFGCGFFLAGEAWNIVRISIARWDAFPKNILGIHPDAMAPMWWIHHADFYIFLGILGDDSPETSSAKKKHYNPPLTSTRYFTSCSDV